MSYQEVESIELLTARNLSAGWFPEVEHNDVVGDLRQPGSPIGANDCDNVVWVDGGLRKIWGYDNVNSSALNMGKTITGIINFTSANHVLVGGCGNKLYTSMNTATPTEITGALTITEDVQISFCEYRIGATKYVIGVNGTDAPFKYNGSGNASLLGGSPPTGKYIEYFNNYIFMAGVTGYEERLYFSALSNPEGWNTSRDFFTFDQAITGLKTFGRMLVVFKEKSIGILSGFGSSSWNKTDQYVAGVGCSAGLTPRNARLTGGLQKDVIPFLSTEGIYAFDGTQNVMKLSDPINSKFTASTAANKFNISRFPYASACYFDKYNWYVLALSDGSDTTNKFMLILDLARPFQMGASIAVPHWPLDTVDANVVATRRVSGTDELYFGGTDGFVYKFDPAIYNRNGSAYTGRWSSKVFDIGGNWILRETNVLGDEQGNTEVNVYVNADLQDGYGETDTVSMSSGVDVLDSTFVLDSSVLGGSDFVYHNADIANAGRFLQFTLRQPDADKQMVVQQVDFVMKEVGLRPNVS